MVTMKAKPKAKPARGKMVGLQFFVERDGVREDDLFAALANDTRTPKTELVRQLALLGAQTKYPSRYRKFAKESIPTK